MGGFPGSRILLLCLHIGCNGSFIIGSSFTLYKLDGLHGAGGETVAEAITIIVSKQNSLSVYNADGSLVAGIGAKTAAITFFLV